MEPAGSHLRGKPFYGREWALALLALSLEGGGGVLVTGGPGSGKTAPCTSAPGLRVGLGDATLAWHFCQAYDADATCTSGCRPGAAGSVDRSGRDLPQNGVAAPLLIGVDALHAAKRDCQEEEEEEEEEERGPTGKSIGHLLGSHLQLLPPWLLLVCSACSHSQGVLHLFPGFRQLCLSDLQREPIICDVQHHILAWLDREEVLRRHFTQDITRALSQLHLKGNGCLLYLEQVEELVPLQEVRHIPETLSGLYLWLCQCLFPHNQFALICPLLEWGRPYSSCAS